MNTPTNASSASVKAKENISNFNKLAASVVAADRRKGAPGRVPFGALNLNSAKENSRPISVVSKKPSGHSHGAKAMKVLGEANTTKTAHDSVDASYNFDSPFLSPSTVDRSTDSTNVKDRVRDWERERERLREMGRLQDLERERDNVHKRERKRRERDEVVVKEKEGRPHNRGSHNPDQQQHDALKEKCLPQIPLSSTQSTNDGVDIGPRWEAPKAHQDIDSDINKGINVPSSAMSPVLPMFSTGPRLTQGMYLVLLSVRSAHRTNVICSVQYFRGHTDASLRSPSV